MNTILDFITNHPIATFFIAFVGSILAWEIYQLGIRPLFIPKSVINQMVDELIEKYGPEAEHHAFINEDAEWRRSHTYRRGIWRRVRRELQRRYRNGEWE
ncbi:MAG: hypothetical protein QM488_12630 [Rhizobiaceae bacterium]